MMERRRVSTRYKDIGAELANVPQRPDNYAPRRLRGPEQAPVRGGELASDRPHDLLFYDPPAG